ncbi:MAG: hypothetical protein A2Y71_09345 [Bacteroidetes bacterium RBG_13_42_15]|nr:MAG: hypothetical protein A2Y71_09345 [Bacteroidetes bacterium RBG_13_42_15]
MKKIKMSLPVLLATCAVVIISFTASFYYEPSNCFTWKVEINKSIFYLTGSVHAANEESFPLPKAYMESYSKADKVILELKDDKNALEQKVMQYAEKDRLKEDQYLHRHLSAASLQKLSQLFVTDELKLNQYYQYESWLLNMAIAGTRSRLTGYNPFFAIDMYFNQLAKKDKKEIIGLDDLQTQLLLFEYEVPFEMQVKIIEKAVSEMEGEAKKDSLLFEAYFKNNIVQFENAFLKTFDFNKPQMKQAYDLVFTNRNIKWVEQFEKLSIEKPGKYFVMVGAGHYFGPNNIRELLEHKGYTIEKI